MIQKIKNSLVILASAFMLAVPVMAPVAAEGVDCTSGIGGSVAKGANGAATGTPSSGCETAGNGDGTKISEIANKVVNVFSMVVGAVAVIMIIVGGFRYITSGGDSGRVGGAKNTIIYAIIGLIIVALAQIIVHFVLNTTASSTV